MPIDAILIIVIGAAFGGLVNGLAGFGTGLFALGWWLQVLPPTSAVALVVILSFVSGVQGAFALRQALNWSKAMPVFDPGSCRSAIWLCYAGWS